MVTQLCRVRFIRDINCNASSFQTHSFFRLEIEFDMFSFVSLFFSRPRLKYVRGILKQRFRFNNTSNLSIHNTSKD